MFSPHYRHHFKFFSVEHLVLIGILVVGILIIILFRRFFARHEFITTRTMLFTLIVLEVGYHIWLVWNGLWKWKTSLPLELCDISMYGCILLLYTKRYSLFEILYFIGIGGELQAIFTPALSYSFPHFLFFHFFIVHSLVVWTILFFVFVKRFAPSFRSIWKALFFLHLVAGIAFLVNRVTGGNYMFLAHKPKTPSLLNILGPYPWYILSLEGVTLVVFFLLWLPFWKRRKKME
ncbi:TIGR02206 family membrane protein [Microbacteriaceae bacterium 4G12]